MNITNRLFTYPVLSEDKNDYNQSIFSVDFEQTMNGVNTLHLSFDITMNCLELEELILKGQAEYVIHLECSTTAYREIIKSVSKHIEYELPIGRINGTFEAVAFIIANKNIRNFYCKDWDDEFAETTFNLSPGSILAYQNLDRLDITKDYEEFTNANSIFSIYKRLTDTEKPAEINLDSSKIKIGLSSKEFDVYSMFSNNSELQPLFHSMLILPALVYVFEELKLEDGEETYHNKEWFISLEKAYLKRGVNFMDEVLNTEKTSYQLAQEAMELPLSKSFDKIPLLFNIGEEDE